MPFVLDNPTIEYSLPCEAHKPEADRILWKCRTLTAGATVGLERAVDAALREPDAAEAERLLNAALQSVVVGWSNVVDAAGAPVPWGPDAPGLLTFAQKLTIVRDIPDAQFAAELRLYRESRAAAAAQPKA